MFGHSYFGNSFFSSYYFGPSSSSDTGQTGLSGITSGDIEKEFI